MNTQATLLAMQSLKLTGMKQAYEAYLALPAHEQSQLPIQLLLARLLEAESYEREQTRKQNLIRQAGFRYQAGVEEIIYEPERNLDKNLLLSLYEMSFIKKGESVLITGATGCGKSYLATALGMRACEQGYKVGYYAMPRLMESLTLHRAGGSLLSALKKIANLPLLILDDFGLYRFSEQTRLTLLEMIEDRYGKQATIITSQLPVSAWYEYIGEPTLADAILDRLLEKCHRIELKGNSLRRAKKENEKSIN